MIQVESQKCLGCGACALVCPTGTIKVIDGVAAIVDITCRHCGTCIDVCPEGALHYVASPVVKLNHEVNVPSTIPAVSLNLKAVPDVTYRQPRNRTLVRIIANDVLPLIWACGIEIGRNWLRSRRVHNSHARGRLKRASGDCFSKTNHRNRARWKRRV
jgi:ferredoxin